MEDNTALATIDPFEHNAEMRAVNEQLVIAALHLQELAEIALRSEQRIRDLVHSLDAVICEVDAQTGYATYLSLRADTFLGKSLTKWRDEPNFLTEIIHPSDRERVTAIVPDFTVKGVSFEYDFRALSADTEWMYMRNIMRAVRDDDEKVQLLYCVIIDVTETRKIEQELEQAYKRERNITENLQRSILFMPPADSFPGLLVNRLYEAASEEALVGGDFSDAFACDHGHVALVLGDVMGHGVPAAMFTAELKYALRGFVREHVSPGRIMSQMNSYLCEGFRLHREGLNNEGNDSPLCLTLAIFNTASGFGTISSAGMEPPLLVRSDGWVEELNVGGLLLGIQNVAEYEELNFQMEIGDSLVLVTDGVTEARQGISFLGYDGLQRLARLGWSKGTLQEMGTTIIDGSREYGGGKLRDDACVLLARRQ